jgi:hypothetical protein
MAFCQYMGRNSNILSQGSKLLWERNHASWTFLELQRW